MNWNKYNFIEHSLLQADIWVMRKKCLNPPQRQFCSKRTTIALGDIMS